MKYKSSLISKGFTLVELLIVISIIAILTGIIVTNLTSSKSKSRDAQRISDVNQIQLALEQYFDRCGQYPSTLDTGSNCGIAGITFASYISKIPQDPLTRVNYDYAVNVANPATDYVLHAVLENTNVAQQNSFPDSAKDSSWVTFSCFDGSGGDKDYCISTR